MLSRRKETFFASKIKRERILKSNYDTNSDFSFCLTFNMRRICIKSFLSSLSFLCFLSKLIANKNFKWDYNPPTGVNNNNNGALCRAFAFVRVDGCVMFVTRYAPFLFPALTSQLSTINCLAEDEDEERPNQSESSTAENLTD